MPRILVVDDDCTTHLILGKMVKGLGYDCDIASDGQEAVAAASKNEYMAILMDMYMPVLNGCDAAVSISRNVKTRDRPSIVGMISIDEPASRDMCFRAGMQGVLSKPIQQSELGQCLHQIAGLGSGTNTPPPPQKKSADSCICTTLQQSLPSPTSGADSVI